MNLVKENLNEEIMVGGEDNSLVLNQVKNVLKNTQALLDLLNTGAVLTPEEGAKLSVMDANIQDTKNRVENEATDLPGETPDAPVEELPPMDVVPGAEGDMDAEIIEPIPAEDIEAPIGGEELPPPFPEDEVDSVEMDVDGDGDVEVLNVETKYEDEVK